jgi:hypothetical protein
MFHSFISFLISTVLLVYVPPYRPSIDNGPKDVDVIGARVRNYRGDSKRREVIFNLRNKREDLNLRLVCFIIHLYDNKGREAFSAETPSIPQDQCKEVYIRPNAIERITTNPLEDFSAPTFNAEIEVMILGFRSDHYEWHFPVPFEELIQTNKPIEVK